MTKIQSFEFKGTVIESDILEKFFEDNKDYIINTISKLSYILKQGEVPTPDELALSVMTLTISLAEAYTSGALENQQ
ncbi:MAG: hypothetical protein KA467_00275 [Bacteroidales bacterium]|nr:hypothetical protein [Bacteroidales bacterium]